MPGFQQSHGIARHNFTRPYPFVPLAVFDFTKGLVGGWTYGGGANGTVWNSAGVLVAGSAGRITFDPATGVCRGLYLEEARTNTAWPFVIDAAGVQYEPANLTATANNHSSPDGTVDATHWVSNTTITNDTADVFQPPSPAIASGPEITLSMFYLPDTTNFGAISIFGGTSNNWIAGAFNASTLAVGATTAGASSGTVSQFNAISQGNGGWARAWLTGHTNSGIGNYTLQLGVTNSTTIAGNSTAGDIFFTTTVALNAWAWGAQFEAGFGPSSPIISVSGGLTRSADTATVPLPLGTHAIVVQGYTPLFIGASQEQLLVQLDDGTDNNRVRVIRNASKNIQVIITSGGSVQATLTSVATVPDNTFFKLATRFFTSDFSMSLNGAATVTSGSGTMPTVTTIRGGTNVAGTNYWMGVLSSLVCWGNLGDPDLIGRST